MTFVLVRDAAGRQGIFPVWNWTRLPGITAWQNAPPETPCSTVKQLGRSKFVGGISDGSVGAAAFDFHANDFYHDSSVSSPPTDFNPDVDVDTDDLSLPGPIAARKSWFFFDGGFVALGANITAQGPQSSGNAVVPVVTTSANQALLHGDVTISNGSKLLAGTHDVSSAAWVHHADVGYVPLTVTQPRRSGGTGSSSSTKKHAQIHDNDDNTTAIILATVGAQTGAWSLLNPAQSNETVSADVFSLDFVHGPSPRGARYVVSATRPGTVVETDHVAMQTCTARKRTRTLRAPCVCVCVCVC